MCKKHQVIEGKGVLNNRISEYVFQRHRGTDLLHQAAQHGAERTSEVAIICLKSWCVTWRPDRSASVWQARHWRSIILNSTTRMMDPMVSEAALRRFRLGQPPID